MTTPAGGDPGPSGRDATRVADGSLPSPLDSVDDMRPTAKWMLAAAGAVGAVLLSGGPLGAVGQGDRLLRAFPARTRLVSLPRGDGGGGRGSHHSSESTAR